MFHLSTNQYMYTIYYSLYISIYIYNHNNFYVQFYISVFQSLPLHTVVHVIDPPFYTNEAILNSIVYSRKDRSVVLRAASNV